MKAFFLNLTFLICTTHLFAQQLTKEAIIGTWKVVSVQGIPEMQEGLDAKAKKTMEEMLTGFMNKLFTFKENMDCEIDFPKILLAAMEEEHIDKNLKWKIKDGQKLVVGTEKDRYSLMALIVRKQAEKTFFMLEETPFILEVVKE